MLEDDSKKYKEDQKFFSRDINYVFILFILDKIYLQR